MKKEISSSKYIDSVKVSKKYGFKVVIEVEENDCLLVVLNFSDVEETFRTGVPFDGEAYELINTDQKEYGGKGLINPGTLILENVVCDSRNYSLELKLAPYSLSVLRLKRID